MKSRSFRLITMLAMLASFGLASCKVEDPFVDRAVSPVLVDIIGAPWAAPLAHDPSVTYPVSAQAITLSARILELDKTNILDHTKGIDSIPVAGISIRISFRNGATIAELTSDANGLVSIQKTWAELGVATPTTSTAIPIDWAGTHNGIAFRRLSQIRGN